jgi:carboxypeptidase Taq
MTVATVRPLFAELRDQLVPLVEQITEREEVDASFLFRTYPEAAQQEFGEMVIRRYGYDFNRGGRTRPTIRS